MQVERVSVDSNFFDDLGADSMVMARFCARVRKRPDLPAVSIKDIYQHPTIKSLATALADDSPVAVESAAATSDQVATPARTSQSSFAGRSSYWPFSDISLSPRWLWLRAMTGFRRAVVCSTSTSGR